jgi:hypothetical protein
MLLELCGVSGGKLLESWLCCDLLRGRCLVKVCWKKKYISATDRSESFIITI